MKLTSAKWCHKIKRNIKQMGKFSQWERILKWTQQWKMRERKKNEWRKGGVERDKLKHFCQFAETGDNPDFAEAEKKSKARSTLLKKH